MDIQTHKLKSNFKCNFCDKSFMREKTLLVHMCEPGRRFKQRNEKPVKVAFIAYKRFYELTQGSFKTKTMDDFEISQYYNAFVKFGWHMYHIKAVDQDAFIDYVINKQIRLHDWCKDSVYTIYLNHYILFERADKAVERSLNTMLDWAENNNDVYNHYFKYAKLTLITFMIQNGRISPWMLYCCDTGINMLDNMSDEQLVIINDITKPNHWRQRFKNEPGDFEWVKYTLKMAGF